MVGDRIYTDLLMAYRAEALGVLVLSGETDLETARTSHPVPDMIIQDLSVFDRLLEAVCERVNVPVVASGGAGSIVDFVTLFNSVPEVSAGLAASIFHFGEVKIAELKRELAKNNINVRL